MKISQFFISVLIITSAMIFSCCSSEDEPEIQDVVRQEIPLSRSQKEYLDNESRFAFDFLKAVNQQEVEGSNGNFVISPISMARDLSMLACGASGETLDEVLKILHLDSSASIEELNYLNRILLDALQKADDKVTLNIFNSFWHRNDFPVKASFKEMIEQNYNAYSSAVDFSKESTRNEINSWISKSTNGEIRDFFEQGYLNQDILFTLLDAVYFKGNWSFTLNEKDTRPMVFFNQGTKAVNVPTMNTKSVSSILGGDESVTLIQLPYGNRTFSMYLIMADEGYDINDVISEFDYDRWKLLKETSIDKRFEFSIPKFDLIYQPDLEDVFESLGLNTFGPQLEYMQDFSVNPEPMVDYLKIRQGSSIKIDETGSVITSATVVAGAEFSAPPLPETEYLHINRPFIFLVEEYSTGAILFAGKVVEL